MARPSRRIHRRRASVDATTPNHRNPGMPSMSPVHAPPRSVFTAEACACPRDAHERASQAWAARRLATLLGWEFAGAHDPRSPSPQPGRAYFVPDETLTTAQADALGIACEDDLFGGVVPHAFVASKVVTHALPGPGSAAPEGWAHALGAHLAGAVLPGFSVFDPDEVEAAGLRLLALGGQVRLKPAQARGGGGQQLVADPQALREAAAALDPDSIRRYGLVLEQHLDQADTVSVGEIRVAGLRLAYLGRQRQIRDRQGEEVYGGSSLRVVRGGLEALQDHARDATERTALRQVLAYDAAVQAAYPGFYASRRNYDVVAGLDPAGRWRCGVLEQSWRLGGASPAELAALEVFLAGDDGQPLDVSCHESHDPEQAPPPGAQVHFHDPAAVRGPVLKYALVDPVPVLS